MAGGDAISTRATYRSAAEVGTRIAELREAQGVPQRRLAEAIGIDQSALSRLESGSRGLAVEELVGIAEFLNVETDTLLRSTADAAPLFRNEGGAGEAGEAIGSFDSIIDDFFAFEAAVRS
jgi:transcriptional regulator with XRE-family HTH domain